MSSFDRDFNEESPVFEVLDRMNPLTIARNRVHDFENEIERKIMTLVDLEKDIKNIGVLRRRWLKSVSIIDALESDFFEKTLKILESKAEINLIKLKTIKIKLEGCYEARHLEYLVAATKPYDDRETPEMRNISLKKFHSESAEIILTALQSSFNSCTNLTNNNYKLMSTLGDAKLEYTTHRSSTIEELIDRITHYSERLEEVLEVSQYNHKKITGDYLILRHNARVARDMLVRSRNKAIESRKLLQIQLDTLLSSAKDQRVKLESSTAKEIQIQTDLARENVITKERELEGRIYRIENIKKSTKSCRTKLLKEKKKFEDKYDDLQNKRRTELKTISEELKRLKLMVTEVESKLTTEDDSTCNDMINNRTNSIKLFKKTNINNSSPIDFLKIVEDRMTELKVQNKTKVIRPKSAPLNMKRN